MIVFEGDYVLEQCLQQVYPWAHQILIAEGPVAFWQAQGRTTSTDRTNEILHGFPDPDHKIQIVHGQWAEKDEQANAYMPLLAPEIDYLWNLDSDELFFTKDLARIVEILDTVKPATMGFRSFSFFGGFDHTLTGFELEFEFYRVLQVFPGCRWKTHRPPTIDWGNHLPGGYHFSCKQGWEMFGLQMYHYSYVFPKQVQRKTLYYEKAVTKGGNIPDHFHKIWLPWVKGTPETRQEIETRYQGVHEWLPARRGPCFTTSFSGAHPEAIQATLPALKARFERELSDFSI